MWCCQDHAKQLNRLVERGALWATSSLRVALHIQDFQENSLQMSLVAIRGVSELFKAGQFHAEPVTGSVTARWGQMVNIIAEKMSGY